jgi:DNA-directed RNA polymerase subunit RPC12/RpoP
VSGKASLTELREEVKREVLEEAERLDVVLKTARSRLIELVDFNKLKEIVEKFEATRTLSESELREVTELVEKLRSEGIQSDLLLKALEPRCPRCGGRRFYIEELRIHGRVYICAVHEVYRGKTRIRWRCYLGPKGEYEYVKRVAYPGVPLTGLRVEESRELERYINALEGLVSEVSRRANPEIKLRVAESLKKAATRLEREAVIDKALVLIKEVAEKLKTE